MKEIIFSKYRGLPGGDVGERGGRDDTETNDIDVRAIITERS